MNGLYSRTNKLLFWKVKETKWIIATATVIIVMASMVFSVSNNITTSYQNAMADMAIPFDMIVTCENDEEVEQALGLATQYDKNILTTISTGDFLLGIPQSNFNLNIMAASDSLVEMYKLSVIEGDFPQNENEIMLDSKVRQIPGRQDQIGDYIQLEAYVESSMNTELVEYKIVGFFDTSQGSAFTLYGYINEKGGTQLSLTLQIPDRREVLLKLSQCSLEKLDGLVDSLLPDFAGRMSVNSAKYSVLFDEENSSVVCRVFSNLGLIVVVLAALLFNGVFRLNILNVQKRIGLLRCMGLVRKQLLVSLGLSWLCYWCGYLFFSLPLYVLCSNMFGPAFFQNAMNGYNISNEVSMTWSFSMKPYLYSLLSVTVVTTLVYGRLLYTVLREKPLVLIRGIEKIKIIKGKRKKEKHAVALIGKRNLLRSKSRTLILGFVFFIMSGLLLVSVVTATTIDFTEVDALKRGQNFDYEFYTEYSGTSWIEGKYLNEIEALPNVESLHRGMIRFGHYFRTEQVQNVDEDMVIVIVYSEEMLSMTCKEAGITYENELGLPQYYLFTRETQEQTIVNIWDIEGKKKELPIAGIINDAVYSYIKAGEDGFMIITNEAGAKELFGEIQYNCFFVELNDRVGALEQINQIMEDNTSPVYYNDLKEFNNSALEELKSMLFMVGYIAACIGFMVIVNIACNITINIITRQKELGILVAMGMTKGKIIHLLIYEMTNILGGGVILSLPISLLLCTAFETSMGQECNYVKMLLVAFGCVLLMYAVCYLICYEVGKYLLKKNITRILSEE